MIISLNSYIFKVTTGSYNKYIKRAKMDLAPSTDLLLDGLSIKLLISIVCFYLTDVFFQVPFIDFYVT